MEQKSRMTIEEFVTDKSGFVDPEKVEAIELYGFEQAKEMWKKGKIDWRVREVLRKSSMLRFLLLGRVE